MSAKKKSSSSRNRSSSNRSSPKRSSRDTKRNQQPNSERVNRPRLTRSEPVRSWSTLFGVAGDDAKRDPSSSSSPFSGVVDPIARGVEMGRRVMEDYYRSASSSVGSSPFSGGGQDPNRMAEVMMQSLSDLGSMWMDTLSMFSGNANPPGAPTGPTEQSASAHSGLEKQFILKLDIQSAKVATATVTIDEPFQTGSLEAAPLTARGKKAVIKDVAVEVLSDPRRTVKIRIRVPTRCPAGRYTGALVDTESRAPVGRLTVSLQPPSTS